MMRKKPIILINGSVQSKLSVNNRNTQFGDGIFETCRFIDNKLLFWHEHVQRLQLGSHQLQLRQIPDSIWLNDIKKAVERSRLRSGIVKLILSRGATAHGYRYPAQIKPVRIVRVYPADKRKPKIRLDVCQSGYGNNPALAGIKHCNRLEQVLASSNLRNDDGIMLNHYRQVISTTRANIFIVAKNKLITPDLTMCGINGTRRAVVLDLAQALDIPIEIRSIMLEEVYNADEVFITNSINGIQIVSHIKDKRYHRHKLTKRLQSEFDKVSIRDSINIKIKRPLWQRFNFWLITGLIVTVIIWHTQTT